MVEDRIRALSYWSGPIAIERLSGGMTNVNYRVREHDAQYVVRCYEDLQHLGIDRRSERVCQEAAFRAGIAPEVVHSSNGMLVSRYIDAPALSAEEVRNEQLLSRLAARLRQLHGAGHELVGEMLYFCPFQTVRTYAATARRLNAKLPAGLDASLEDAARLSLEIGPFHPTLCHNDLLAPNIIDDGQTLWLVDWEYAGMGNPAFDLASVSSNSQLDDELEAAFLQEYAGANDERLRREVEILKSVSLLREALWAVIQSVKSNIDFDYEQYAAKNLTAYREARRKLEIG